MICAWVNKNYLSRSIILVHIILVYTHVFLLSSSLLGHDAETNYVGRECADKVDNLLG